MLSGKWQPFCLGFNVLRSSCANLNKSTGCLEPDECWRGPGHPTLPICDVMQSLHDDIIKWKHFSRYWPFRAGNSPVPGEFPAQRPVTWSFDFSLICVSVNAWVKQSCGWWFEMPSCSLWRHCNVCSQDNGQITQICRVWLSKIVSKLCKKNQWDQNLGNLGGQDAWSCQIWGRSFHLFFSKWSKHYKTIRNKNSTNFKLR